MATCTDEHLLYGLFGQEFWVAWILAASVLHVMHASVVQVQVVGVHGCTVFELDDFATAPALPAATTLSRQVSRAAQPDGPPHG